ncbi:putative acetyltransferase YhhY [Clostridiales bacterium CHKCI001]|nr:putative acetyltransferase YhhY [Clostridiales bacterium CHKCI001]
MQIRNLRIDEIEAFWNMLNQLDKETQFMLYEPGEREKRGKPTEGLKRMIESSINGTDFLLIAEVDQEIVGYIMAERGRLNRVSHRAYIVIGIRERYRGRGIGTEFFKRLEKWAKEQQLVRLELTVMCSNTSAKQLYEKNGFVVEGIKKKSMFVNESYVDEYYMAKILETVR